MQNRDYKQYVAGEYYHIYNRGNDKRIIFLEPDDYKFFMFRLKQNLLSEKIEAPFSRISILPPGSFSLINYCLMPNHFHFLIRQNTDLPTSKFILKLCTSYAKYFNKKYKKVGHVFQDRFKQVLIDDNSYLTWLSAYIHQNPKIAGLVNDAADYEWSSYQNFLGIREDNLCEKGIILDQFKNKTEYKKFADSSYKIIKARKDIEGFLLDEES